MKKTVVITGAAGQIGKAIAQTFALNDFRVVAVDVNPLSEMLLDLPNQNLQHMGITEHSICSMDGVRDVFRDIPTDFRFTSFS